MLYALGVLQNAASEDIDLNADQVYHTLIGKTIPQALRSAVIGQYNDVNMDVSKFVIFIYFPFLGLRCFSFWVGSWVWDLSFRFRVLVSVLVSRVAPLSFGSLLGYLTVVLFEGFELY